MTTLERHSRPRSGPCFCCYCCCVFGEAAGEEHDGAGVVFMALIWPLFLLVLLLMLRFRQHDKRKARWCFCGLDLALVFVDVAAVVLVTLQEKNTTMLGHHLRPHSRLDLQQSTTRDRR